MRVERPAASTMAATGMISANACLALKSRAPRQQSPRSARRSFTQVLGPEGQHPLPGQFGGGTVMHVALLVDEGMVGLVAEDFRRLAGRGELGREFVDRGRRAPVVAV